MPLLDPWTQHELREERVVWAEEGLAPPPGVILSELPHLVFPDHLAVKGGSGWPEGGRGCSTMGFLQVCLLAFVLGAQQANDGLVGILVKKDGGVAL